MSIVNKYPLENWVLSQDHVQIGDTVAFYDEQLQQEIKAKILGFPSSDLKQYLTCKRPGANYSEVINIYDVIVYRLNEEFIDTDYRGTKSRFPECTCGAKHTSNPKFHLSYCDVQ
jgi:hypothetical protein